VTIHLNVNQNHESTNRQDNESISDDIPEPELVKKAKQDATQVTKTMEAERTEEVTSTQTPEVQRRLLEQLSEPGASSWLGALPIKQQNFHLTKHEFHDALSIRYLKDPKNLPSECPCGKTFNVTHAMDCHLGGFVNARHDDIRDAEHSLLKIVCNDVETEPMLQPVVNKLGYKASAILDNGARLDVRARGFWRNGQNAFFDVRVTNADNRSQQDSSLKAVLRKHELEKKRQYNRRVMQVEHLHH
jgi:hypothetical protein